MQGSRRNVVWIVALLVVVVLVALTVGVLVGRSSTSSAATVTLEPAGSASSDAFTSSITTGAVDEFADAANASNARLLDTLDTDPESAARVAVGTTPGLYGGTGDEQVCDPHTLVDYLSRSPDKAAAWASVFAIGPDDIAGYVASLTPVLLTHDTLVTNHGYSNGEATARASVLQRGTAVLVDSTGTPRVKCNCGNPLAPPEAISLTSVKTTGEAWPDYTPTTVIVVQSGATTNNLVVINVTTGDTYEQPVGPPSDGGAGSAGTATSTSTTSAVNSAAGPCTQEAIQPAIATPIGPPTCEGEWAIVVSTDANGDEGIPLLHWNGQAWEQVLDRQSVCPQLPPSIHRPACEVG